MSERYLPFAMDKFVKCDKYCTPFETTRLCNSQRTVFYLLKGIDKTVAEYKYYRVKTVNEGEKNYLGNVYRIESKSEVGKKQASMLNQLLLFVFAIWYLAGHGQTDRGSVLYATIMEKYSLLFAGFNNCDIALLQEHVS